MHSTEVKENERLSPLVWKVTAVAILGSLLAQLDATIVNVSLSSLATDLHSRLSVVQWVTSGYLLALAFMLPLSGWFVDRVGAKNVYLWSFCAFTASSALCGTAWSAESLIGFRVLQGMSGGLMAPMAQMMMARVAGRNMARVIGYAAVPVLLGPILGPTIAGALLQYASWRWLFFVNVPVGILAVVLAAVFLPNDREEAQPHNLDVLGLLLISPGLVLLLFGFDHTGTIEGTACVAAAAMLLAVFVWTSKRKGDASIVNLGLFRNRVFAAGTTVMFLANGTSFAGQMLIPLYLIRMCGYSPVATGAAMAPLGIGMMCGYPMMGRLVHRFGARAVSLCGGLLAFAGTLPLLYMAVHGPAKWLLVAALFVRGAGMSAIGVPSITSAYSSVPRRELPMATTTMNICQRIGGPTMTTLVAVLLEWQLHRGAAAEARMRAFVVALSTLAAAHLLVSLAALRLPVKVSAAAEAVAEMETVVGEG